MGRKKSLGSREPCGVFEGGDVMIVKMEHHFPYKGDERG